MAAEHDSRQNVAIQGRFAAVGGYIRRRSRAENLLLLALEPARRLVPVPAHGEDGHRLAEPRRAAGGGGREAVGARDNLRVVGARRGVGAAAEPEGDPRGAVDRDHPGRAERAERGSETGGGADRDRGQDSRGCDKGQH